MGSSLWSTRATSSPCLHSMTVLMGASLLVTLFSVVYLAAFGPGLRPAYQSLTRRTALGVVFFDRGTDSLNALDRKSVV